MKSGVSRLDIRAVGSIPDKPSESRPIQVYQTIDIQAQVRQKPKLLNAANGRTTEAIKFKVPDNSREALTMVATQRSKIFMAAKLHRCLVVNLAACSQDAEAKFWFDVGPL